MTGDEWMTDEEAASYQQAEEGDNMTGAPVKEGSSDGKAIPR